MISRDVSATMYDVINDTCLQKTRLKTIGLFDPNEVCAYRGQTVYRTTELCLSVDQWEEDNKQGRNDVCVQCLCNVQSVTCGKLKELTPLLECRRLLKAVSCHHLSAVIVPFAVPTFVPQSAMCDTNLCRTSCQCQSSTGSPLRKEVLKSGFACFSNCSFVFTM